MTNHAKLSPSGAHRWMNCPGSLELSRQFPSTSSVYADEGTFAHDVAADALNEGKDAAAFLGYESTCGRFTVDAEMVQHVQSYLDVVRRLPAERGLHVEKKVRLFKDLWGTADAIAVGDDAWHVVDLKYGQGVLVEVEDNPQLMIYALAALSTLRKAHGEPRRVWIHVVQPRHPQGGHAMQEWSTRQLLRWKDEVLVPAVRAARRGTRRLRAGDWCKFCPAAQSCPEVHRSAMETARSAFSDVPTLRDEISGPIRPEDLTPDQLGQVLALLPTVEAWIKHLRANALERMLSGQQVPGTKLVRTAPHRRWIDEDAALEALSKVHDPAELVALKSPAQVEKVLDKEHKVVVSSHVEVPEGQLKLAPASDRRRAASVLPAFQPIEDQESEKASDGES